MHGKSLLICVLLSAVAAADTFYLHTGGQVEGRLLNPDQIPRTSYQIRLTNGGEVTLEAKDVRRHRPLTKEEQAYRALLKRMPADTAVNHWKMAEQCRIWRLPRERELHLKRVIELEPDHEKARAALRFKRDVDGTWTTTEQLQQDAGLVRHGGKWMTKQQRALDLAIEQREAGLVEWKKKLRLWRTWLRNPRRRQTGWKSIGGITDPLAATSLSEMFWEEKDAVALRRLIAEVLGRLESSVAVNTLAKAALETNTEMRLHCVRQLKDNGRTQAAGYFVSALGSSSSKRIRRAGYALGQIGSPAAVLPLIRAVQTQHTEKVSGGGGNGINASFDPTGRSGGGLSMGKKKPKYVTRNSNNKEVRNALNKLTGQDFQYNKSAWLGWYLKQTTASTGSLRRDL